LISATIGAAAAYWPPYQAVLGKQTLAVITVDFSDTSHATSRSSLYESIFVRVNAYYMEASFNQTWIEGYVTERWYRLPGTSASYDWDGKSNPRKQMETFVKAVIALADSEVDYSKFEYVTIVHSGKWVAAWGFVDPFSISTNDGRFQRNVAILSEKHSLSVFAHEFGHIFGYLPDMYGRIGGDNLPVFAGPWDLMSSTEFRMPQHFSAWSKIKLGWIPSSRVAIVQAGKTFEITLDPSDMPSNGTQAFIVRLAGQTYYLGEVRQRVGFDRQLPDYGLVIYLVDETKNEWGESPIIVQDSNPETPTLNDATFDLRSGKSSAFIDGKNNVGVVIAGKVGQSYRILVSTASAATANLEKIRAAFTALAEARGEFQKAWNEGRIQGLDEPRSIIDQAQQAFDTGDMDRALELATKAKSLAVTATRPQSYQEAQSLITQANTRIEQAEAKNFRSPAAWQFLLAAKSEYQLAVEAFKNNKFEQAVQHAARAIELTQNAIDSEAQFLETTTATIVQASPNFNIYLIGAAAAVAVAILSLLVARKVRKK